MKRKLSNTSHGDRSRKNVRRCPPAPPRLPPAPQTLVSLQEPHGFELQVQSMDPNQNVRQQSPTSAFCGGSYGSIVVRPEVELLGALSVDEVHNQSEILILAGDENLVSISLEGLPPCNDLLIQIVLVRNRSLDTSEGSAFLYSITWRAISPDSSPSNSSQNLLGTAENHSQHQVLADNGMDIQMSYEGLIALGERIGKVNTGVKRSELFKFVKKSIFCGEQDNQCVICQDQFGLGDVIGQLKCSHEYHYSCIGKWMKEKAVCPICRRRAAPLSVGNSERK